MYAIRSYYELRRKLKKAGMPEEVEKEAEKQLRRLEGMHPDSAESSVVRTYLDWMVELPWKKETKDNINLAKAKTILDEDHHDLDKVKERILEYLAVRKLKDKAKGVITSYSIHYTKLYEDVQDHTGASYGGRGLVGGGGGRKGVVDS